MEPHERSDKIQVLILSPTRELALQIESQVEALLKATRSTSFVASNYLWGYSKVSGRD